MSETNKQAEGAEAAVSQAVASAVAKTVFGGDRKPGGFNRDNRNGGNRPRGGKRPERKEEFEQRILDIARVTRVMKGGKRMSFRACVVIGDKRGNLGTGLGKGADVTLAVNKAVNQAKKHMINVPIINDTIPHDVYSHIGASKILFKPAKKGKGVIAGGVVRVILELAGIKNAYSKILGGGNKINNASCTIAALSQLKKVSRPQSGDKARAAKAAEVKESAAKDAVVKTEKAAAKPAAKAIKSAAKAEVKKTEPKK